MATTELKTMELQHINIKIFVDGELTVDPAYFVDLFHAWVRDESMDELLIDVADYRHVPNGPGVMLIGLEGDYSMDHRGGRWGLLYNRKAPIEGTNEDRMGQALRSAAKACQDMEDHFKDQGSLHFDRKSFELFVNDRALAPNTTETFESCKPIVEGFVTAATGQPPSAVDHLDAPRSRFGVTVQLPQPFEWSTIAST